VTVSNDRANEIIERLRVLDVEIANARSLRVLLEDLHKRNLPGVEEPHVTAIRMVRAGILRALISSVMACLERGDRRDNRASIGQLFAMLENAQVVAEFVAKPRTATLQEAKAKYATLVKSELFDRGRTFRDAVVAHKLNTAPPEVRNETFYELHDEAEQLAVALFEVCGRPTPAFLDHQDNLTAHAKIFWDTYFEGMATGKSKLE
jgi:hypothetical protein